MLSAFWNGIGGKLAEQWVARLLTPALLFWGTGGLAWCWSERPPGDRGLVRSLGRALQHQALTIGRLSGAEQIALLVAALLTVAGSAVVVAHLTAPFLRMMEGYWPYGHPRWLWNLLVLTAYRRRCRLRSQWSKLLHLTAQTRRERITRDVIAGRLRAMPADHESMMPTAFGNILRASELRLDRRYGLDPVLTWPRLWLLLPDTPRTEIASSRGQLDAAGRGILWALLGAVWSAFVWWIALAAVLLAFTLYRTALLPAARVYADLVESAFDLHRPALYDALRLQQPEQPAHEYDAGRRLTHYIWDGPALQETAPTTISSDGAKSHPPSIRRILATLTRRDERHTTSR